jgi:hypothetical protein
MSDAPARGKGGKWLPGKSGNPGGRPAVLEEVRDLARRETAASIKRLAQIRDDAGQPAQARVSACAHLLDRAWGKPQQAIVTENLHRYVARLPEKAFTTEEWAAAHAPAAVTQPVALPAPEEPKALTTDYQTPPTSVPSVQPPSEVEQFLQEAKATLKSDPPRKPMSFTEQFLEAARGNGKFPDVG